MCQYSFNTVRCDNASLEMQFNVLHSVMGMQTHVTVLAETSQSKQEVPKHTAFWCTGTWSRAAYGGIEDQEYYSEKQ